MNKTLFIGLFVTTILVTITLTTNALADDNIIVKDLFIDEKLRTLNIEIENKDSKFYYFIITSELFLENSSFENLTNSNPIFIAPLSSKVVSYEITKKTQTFRNKKLYAKMKIDLKHNEEYYSFVTSKEARLLITDIYDFAMLDVMDISYIENKKMLKMVVKNRGGITTYFLPRISIGTKMIKANQVASVAPNSYKIVYLKAELTKKELDNLAIISIDYGAKEDYFTKSMETSVKISVQAKNIIIIFFVLIPILCYLCYRLLKSMQKSYIRNKNLVTDIEKVLLDYNAVLFGDYELAIEKYLAKDNYEGAVKKYNTLMSLYKTFGDKEKKDILEKINVIYGKIKLYSLLTKLVDYSKNGEINNIKLVLSSISELEPGLVAEFKDIDLKIKIQTKIDYLKQHLKKTYGLDIKIDELEEKTTMIENCLAKNSVESAKNIFNELKQKLASKNRFSTLIKDTEAKIMIYQKLIELTSKMENITEKTIILKDIEDIESCYNDITSKIQSKELKQSLNEKYMLLKGYKLALR